MSTKFCLFYGKVKESLKNKRQKIKEIFDGGLTEQMFETIIMSNRKRTNVRKREEDFMTRQEKQDEELRRQLCGKAAALIDRLVKLAEEGEAKPTTVVAAIKEIRAAAEELRERLPQRVEIVVKVADE